MNVGDTFFGLDEKNHLWIILSDTADDGSVAAANFTTHDPGRRPTCSADCVVVVPGEHPYPTHDSCIFYLGAALPDLELIESRVAEGRYETHQPLSPSLLARVQQGALRNLDTPAEVRVLIQQSLGQS